MSAAEGIYRAACDLPVGQRGAYLDQVCGGDVVLRARLEAMLENGAVVVGPSEEGAGAADFSLRLREDELELPGERVGSVIGRYKLLQRIGEGGMGVVYMAEQSEPIIRRVALKIIKLGMDTRQVVARFEAERQALAMMDHPNIAKVLDAGATDSGRPYFVMELVHGVPITEFCDRNRLSLRERIELFLPVCRAIQSAHQKGVMHRDIKPSNVMVTLHHGDPMPKVIDFGVAKATNQRLTEKTVFTQYGTMIGTPAYMSPEQAEMSSLDVDRRTDVYSLGVLLYELLAGSTPFAQERLQSLGFGQLLKVLAEEEPDKPSQRVSTLEGDRKTAVALSRRLRLEDLRGGIPGDLDWIVMKCLEKDRRRRYDTVNGLTMDLLRHLADEPVLARPPSTAYRFQKAFRRHRVAFLGLAAVLVALAAGLGFATWQALRARRAEALAEDRRKDAEAIAGFLTEVFQSPDPERSGYSFTVAEAIGHATERLEKDLVDAPERRASLQGTLGDTYDAIGLHREAIPLREKVLAHHRGRLGSEHETTLQAMAALARTLIDAHRFDEALPLHREVLAIRERTAGADSPAALGAAEEVANACSYMGRQDEAIALLARIVDARRRIQGKDHPDTLRALGSQAVVLGSAGRRTEAIALQEEVLQRLRATLGAEHAVTLTALANLVANYNGVGRTEDALRLQRELIALRRKVLGPGHPQTLMAMHYLAFFQQDRHPEGAILAHREVAELRRKYLGPEHPDTILSLHYLGLACLRAGRADEALIAREEVVRLRRRSNGVAHPHTVDSMARLACSYLQVGRESEALGLLDECAANLSIDTWLSLRVATLLAWFQRDAGFAAAAQRILRHAEAEARPDRLTEAVEAACLRPLNSPELQETALAAARRAGESGTDTATSRRARFALGLAQFRSGHWGEADTALQAAAPDPGDSSTLAQAASFFRAAALHRQGRGAEARQLLETAEGVLPPAPAAGDLSRDGEEARQIVAWLAHREARRVLGLPESAPGTRR